MKKRFALPRLQYRKLKDKLFIFLFTALLALCVLSMVAFRVAFNFYDGQLYNEAAKVINLLATSIENELKKTEKLSFLILSDPNVQADLLAIRNLPQGYSGYQATENLHNILLSYALAEDYIASISLLDSKGGQFIVGVETKLKKEQNEEILQEALKHEGKNIWLEPDSTDRMLKSARVIRQIPGLSLEVLGLLVIRVDMNKLVNQVAHFYPGFELYLQILSAGRSIYATEKSITFEDHSNPLADELSSSTWGRNYGIKTVNRNKYFIAYTNSAYNGWTYVNIIPFANINHQIVILRNIMIVFFSVVFGLVAVVGLKLTKSITKPFENLTLKMKQVESGDFSVGKEFEVETGIEEIAVLNRNFKIMVEKINNLIQENYIKQLLIKETKYKILQAQINPHFLYNTLDSINWLAIVDKQEKISVMVESLGNLLRNSLGKRDIITIRDEINILENYVKIQQIRYEERLQFQLVIDEEILGCQIPKLTIQPIVENAINYGLEQIPTVCRIEVRGGLVGGEIQITVTDNGPGMDEDILGKIREGKVQPQGLGIGLSNIDERLKMAFGREYGIVISSQQQGSTVQIHIPCEEDPGRIGEGGFDV